MIKSFSEYINESMDSNLDFLKRLARELINKIKQSPKQESEEYLTFSGMEFTSPFMFDLVLYVRRDQDPDLKSDSHFNDLSWEKLNYQRHGYSIDANTRMGASKTTVPSIKVHMILNPRREPSLYNHLYSRLLDILTHETNHLDQLGINRDPFNVNVSNPKVRERSKKSYKYFLLPDEVESMIEGMYVRSKDQNMPLDEVFFNYLEPFLQTRYLSMAEFQKVMNVWIRRSLELYPDAEFSPLAKEIIDSI